jgi:DtxR family Mn-dependent transcriptional regulator
VTEMLHRLERDGYVTLDRTTGARLTSQGVASAEASLRRHRLAERFLADVLKMDWIAAHEQAHSLQNGLSPAIEAQMVVLLGNPTTCPHGNPIPGSAPSTLDFLHAHQALRLGSARPGAQLRVLCISEVVEDETELLRSVGEKGIRPNVDLVVRENRPTDSTLTIDLNGESTSLSRDIADKIWVCAISQPAQAPLANV